MSAAFNRFGLRANLAEAFHGLLHERRILAQFVRQQEELYRLCEKNPLITDFQQLGMLLKTNGNPAFRNFEPDRRSACSCTSSRLMCIFEDDNKPQQKT